MKKSIRSVFLAFVILAISLSCGVVSTSVPPTDTPSPIPPTFTPEPTATATVIPSPTPLPGSVVLPVDTLGKNIPWLPLDNSAKPGTYIFYFNLSKPPFNSVLVRQAFAAAIDRNLLVEVAKKYGTKNVEPATTYLPSQTLGRDLYNEVGIPFDPTHAKDLLVQAGYTDTSKFPPITLLINVGGDAAPGFHVKITDEMVKMWEQHLGVEVNVQVLNWGEYNDRIRANTPDIFRITWVAEFNDPDDFLKEVFKSGAEYNFTNFANAEFDKLINRAASSTNPAQRQELYIQAERILCEIEAAIIPIYHATY